MSGRQAELGREVTTGLLVATDPKDGSAWYVTECCQASAKGSTADGRPAVVCRSCYREVDPRLGGIVEGPVVPL